jgi:hypothetical protein
MVYEIYLINFISQLVKHTGQRVQFMSKALGNVKLVD